MTISEESRHRLYGRLEEVLGEEQAATLMEHLPPVGWADVATRRDLDHLAAVQATELRSGITALGSDLRVEMAAMGAELRSEMAAIGAELRGELVALGAELRSELARVRTHVRTLFLGLVGLQLTGAGLAVAVSRLV